MNEHLQPATYKAVFEQGAGPKVLEELTARFYDIPSYTKNDPYETAFKEGQRSVLRFLIAKLGQIDTGEQE